MNTTEKRRDMDLSVRERCRVGTIRPEFKVDRRAQTKSQNKRDVNRENFHMLFPLQEKFLKFD